MKEEFGYGAKLWLYFCSVVNGIDAVRLAYILISDFGHHSSAVVAFIAPFFAIAGCICFGLIIKYRIRLPFFIIVGLSAASIVIVAFIIWSSGIPAVLLAVSMSSVNPIITFFVLWKYWPFMPLTMKKRTEQ